MERGNNRQQPQQTELPLPPELAQKPKKKILLKKPHQTGLHPINTPRSKKEKPAKQLPLLQTDSDNFPN